MLLNNQEILYTQGSTSLLNLMLKFATTNQWFFSAFLISFLSITLPHKLSNCPFWDVDFLIKCKNKALDISFAPMVLRWLVINWTSNNENLFKAKIPINAISANFDPFELLENMLSAKKTFPIATPYRPPFKLLSSQISIEWAYPRSCKLL